MESKKFLSSLRTLVFVAFVYRPFSMRFAQSSLSFFIASSAVRAIQFGPPFPFLLVESSMYIFCPHRRSLSHRRTLSLFNRSIVQYHRILRVFFLFTAHVYYRRNFQSLPPCRRDGSPHVRNPGIRSAVLVHLTLCVHCFAPALAQLPCQLCTFRCGLRLFG